MWELKCILFLGLIKYGAVRGGSTAGFFSSPTQPNPTYQKMGRFMQGKKNNIFCGKYECFFIKKIIFPEHEDEVMVGGNEEGIEMIRAKDGM